MLMEQQTIKSLNKFKNYYNLNQRTGWINCKTSTSTGKVKVPVPVEFNGKNDRPRKT